MTVVNGDNVTIQHDNLTYTKKLNSNHMNENVKSFSRISSSKVARFMSKNQTDQHTVEYISSVENGTCFVFVIICNMYACRMSQWRPLAVHILDIINYYYLLASTFGENLQKVTMVCMIITRLSPVHPVNTAGLTTTTRSLQQSVSQQKNVSFSSENVRP